MVTLQGYSRHVRTAAQVGEIPTIVTLRHRPVWTDSVTTTGSVQVEYGKCCQTSVLPSLIAVAFISAVLASAPWTLALAVFHRVTEISA